MNARMQIMRLAVLGATLIASPCFAQAVLQERNGEPFHELTPDQLAAFFQGKADYSNPLGPADGLGPVFNKSNCGSCHGAGTIIGGHGTIQVTLFGADDKGSFVSLEELGGPIFQLNSINSECHEVIPPEATIIVNRKCLGALSYGLVEAVADADLQALEDPFDSDGDGISGRAHIVESLEFPGVFRVGRFGWKAQIATTIEFSADAALGEMGLTNRIVPDETPPNGDYDLLAECDLVADPEDGPDANGEHFIDRVTTFQRYIAPPPQTPRSGMLGEEIFTNIGCAKCHTPILRTADDKNLEPFLRDREFKPYSDFLLHCMGLLGDNIRTGDAFECEMKTPTLWGLRWRDPLLHDGRAAGGTFADRVTAAIGHHGPFGEGAEAAANFAALSEDDKAALIRFLDSLGRNEFDYDGDEDVDLLDFFTFRDCFVLDNVISPEDPCAIGDIDQDGDCDNDDADFFIQAFDGEIIDCNNNGIADLLDILSGAGTDADNDGELDDCVCVGDIDGNGAIDGADLATILGHWNTDFEDADLDGSGTVDGADLTIVLGSWGDCN